MNTSRDMTPGALSPGRQSLRNEPEFVGRR
jgi:hypothetical protein